MCGPMPDECKEATAARELIMQAIGAASMCWQPTPTGVFDSTKAQEIGENLMTELVKIYKTALVAADSSN